MNTDGQTIVVPELAERVRAELAAFADTIPVHIPWPPPHRTRRQRLATWRRHRQHQPTAAWAIGLCYVLGAAIALELVALALHRYGGHINWVRFMGSWPA